MTKEFDCNVWNLQFFLEWLIDWEGYSAKDIAFVVSNPHKYQEEYKQYHKFCDEEEKNDSL